MTVGDPHLNPFDMVEKHSLFLLVISTLQIVIEEFKNAILSPRNVVIRFYSENRGEGKHTPDLVPELFFDAPMLLFENFPPHNAFELNKPNSVLQVSILNIPLSEQTGFLNALIQKQ